MTESTTTTEATPTAPAYPEHERQAKVLDKSQAIGEFLEWLTSEQGYTICEWTDSEYADGRYHDVHRPIESWLAQYFQIDPAKIEAEKRAMLTSMRAAQGLDAEGREVTA